MNSTYQLVARSGPTAGTTYPLDKQQFFVGRDLNNDIIINDPEVSRRHARLYLQGANFILEDLGSTNGTMINGQRLMGPQILKPGDTITFGERINLAFEMPQASAADVTLASGVAGGYEAPVYAPPQPAPAAPASSPYLAAVPAAEPYAQPAPEPYGMAPQSPAYPAYAGQVPGQPQQMPLEQKKKFPVVVIIIVILLLLLCICVAGLIAIDTFGGEEMWCSLLGPIFNAMAPGTCP